MSVDRTCQETVLALPWLLNGSLEAEERREVREHLIGCPACRAELARTRQTLALFGEAQRAAAAPAPTAGSRAAGGESPRLGGVVLHRLAWAAMIAMVVASAAGLWLGTRDGGASRAGGSAPATSQPAPAAEPIFSTSFEGGSLATLAIAAPEPPAAEMRAAASRPPRKTERITARITAHPAAPPASPPAVISSVDFENGQLGELN